MMALVMKTKIHTHSPEVASPTTLCTDEEGWSILHARIRQLALQRSALLLAEAGEEAEVFDRGARALRTLMSAAQVAGRMRREEAKETELHEPTHPPAASDAEIENVYQSVKRAVRLVEERDHSERGGARRSEGEDGGGSAASILSSTGGETLEDQRS